MVNDKRPSRKTKDDSSSSALNSTSGDASGLRRTTRSLNNSSPVSLRKSQRLEKRSPPSTPSSLRKKNGKPSPLRRTVKENSSQSQSQSPSSKGIMEKGSPSSKGSKVSNKGLITPESLKEKQDKTLKEIAEEVKEQSKQNLEVGNKRKKRLDARCYRDMFKPLKKSKTSTELESGSDKKSRLEDCDDSGDSGPEKVEEGQEEHSKAEGSNGDCANNADDSQPGGSDSDVNNNICVDGICQFEDAEGPEVSRVRNLPSPSSPKNEAAKNSDETEQDPTDGSVIEKLSDQEVLPVLNKLSDNGVDMGCSQKVTTLGDSGVGIEGTNTRPTDALSVSASCRMSILAEECAQCFRKRRLDRDSPEQELCCCLSNTETGMDDAKDRGQCGTCLTAEFADEHGQNVGQSDSSVDVQGIVCVICKLAGKLLHCGGKGCKTSYHPSCALPPEENIYLLNCFCYDCTKKRLSFGVHSVSQGIESILGVREVESSDSEGRQRQKQFFVKYKGLAHVHNRWVPEIQLLHEDPELCLKLGTPKEWNPSWAAPHRLLHRRAVIVDSHHNESDPEVSPESNCKHEWLVKWCGLDYDQATWESEDSPCFNKPDAQRLIDEYEARHNKARKTSNEVQEKRKGSLKLGKLLVGGADSCYVNSVNKLRDYYHKGHNAVLLDEQDRFVKVVYLVLSLVMDVFRPFLIITTEASLSSWEAEFVRLAASVNVVVYGGNADARNIIRSLEFYKDDGQVMLQVLISTVEAIAEDVEDLKGIEWEAVLVDDCQQSCILAQSGCIMNLATGWRLLLMNTQLKDSTAEYFNILSLLEPGGSQKPGPVANSNEDINALKDRLSSFIICARFLEYWVPVEISNLQLEQYCYSILSNSSGLRSFVKSDPVGSLRDILISLRKCCDHPYVVDPLLQSSLAEGLTQEAVMNLGIRASGKLHLLDNILSEFKNQGRKVLILFQPTGGSGRDTTGNILEDFLRWRFGPDSYEHIASGLLSSKKQAACNKFNSVREISFLLLETRACSQIIKLMLVDAVVIFDSDWNPLNDLKALQKITVDSKLEQIKVFRLYCAYTIEEKVLILAKNNTILDSTLQISPSISHLLLMWGSSYLFLRLDEFHHENFPDSKDNIVSGSSLLTDVSHEIVSLFQNHKSIHSSKYISVARQIDGCYIKSIPLIGEQKIQLEDEMPPHVFWTNLLEAKQPLWKYLSGSSHRNRKRVQYCEETSSGVQSDEAAKKRKKMDTTKIDSSSRQAEASLEKSHSGNKEHQAEKSGIAQSSNPESMRNNELNSHKNVGPALSFTSNGILGAPAIAEFNDIKNLHNEQRGHFELLKPSILQLCEALLLKDDGKILVGQFLEYLVKNYRVIREPETRLQAFLLSVCWTAAEALKKEIDHKNSLNVVKEKMRFTCSECEAEDMYSKLKPKMDMFSRLGTKNSHTTGNCSLAVCGTRIISNGNGEGSPPGNLQDVEPQETSLGVELLKKQGLSPGQTEKDFQKHIKKVENGCEKQMERLKDNHNDEIKDFEKCWEEKRMELEKWCKVQSAAIRVTHANSSIGNDKLRALDNDYAKKREELEIKISICRKDLETRQQIERLEEEKRIARYMERIKSLEHQTLSEESHAKNGVKSQVTEPNGGGKDSNGTVCMNGNLPQQQYPERKASRTPEVGTKSVGFVFAEYLENTEKQRVSCENDGTSTCSPEQPGDCTRQTEKEDTNLMDDAVVDRSTALASNQISSASITGSLPSPVGSVAKQLTADMSQGLGNECHPGVGEQVLHATAAHNTLCLGESSSLHCSDRIPSDLPHNEGTHASVESSSRECITRSCPVNEITVVPNGRLNNQPSESHTSIGGIMIPRHQDHNSASVLGEAVSQPIPQLAADQVVDASHIRNNASASVARAIPAHASHANRMLVPIATMPRAPISNYSDPLQNEFDKMRNEMGNIMLIHEQMKLQLKSECDKEIEELVARIRRKYDKKLDEAEASFSLKRNELETWQNKVMMNKMLAEAFRSKCTDYKAAPRLQQLGIASSSLESASQLHYVRPISAGAAFSVTSPAIGSSSAASPMRTVRPTMALSTQASVPRTNPVTTTAGQQQQVRREAHASAPHIQPFLSASSAILSNSMPAGNVLMVQPSDIPTSNSAPHLPPQPLPFPPSTQLKSHGQSHQDESMGGGARLSLSLSATELLMDLERLHDANLRQTSGNVPSLPDNVRNSESWDISQFEGAINLQLPTSDVVCLSDDE
ncbi:helicase protein MOM1 isoform X3 [Beta vulgaris subsp. vulgaris]|uniref:helicase protein MOM1 isoform X3 n=1 Tax=Beta vulgaris subsp. vulgaris TaxID=3555 RepID=UPI002036E777|nr:helicase protein MOM1 isoform X3 [Beta vulgaris subsp. vulgaris]